MTQRKRPLRDGFYYTVAYALLAGLAVCMHFNLWRLKDDL